MTQDRYSKLVEERLENTRQVLVVKGKEYTRNNNPLHNFDRAAQRANTIREKALLGMMLKHDVSLLDIVDDIEQGKLPTVPMLKEKIGDSINYLILLEASIIDRIESTVTVNKGLLADMGKPIEK